MVLCQNEAASSTDRLKRDTLESIDDYALRLYSKKSEYGLNTRDIGDMLNAELGLNKDESAYRKFYAGVKYGIEYQKRKSAETRGDISTRILCLSDFHYPFQLPIETFKEWVGRVDVLVLNGDLLDMQSISRFQKSFRVPFKEELVGCREYLISLINYLSPKMIFANNGNHEERLSAYMNKYIDTDVKELLPDSPLEYLLEDGFFFYDKRKGTKTWYAPLKEVFPSVEITYTHNWWCQIGGVIFTHPKAFSSAMMKTAEKAMQWFRNEGNQFTALVMAHTHRLGSYKIGNTELYEQGCCCDVSQMNYNGGLLTNEQKEGFLYLGLGSDNTVVESKLVPLN